MKKRGQVVVEYVLLLIFVVSISLILLNFVKLDQRVEGGGPLLQYWYTVMDRIGQDNDE